MAPKKKRYGQEHHVYNLVLPLHRYRDLKALAAFEFVDMADIINEALDAAISRLKKKHFTQELVEGAHGLSKAAIRGEVHEPHAQA